MRPSKRQPDEMRAISFERGVSKHAEGSCLVKFGDTHVLCTASLEEKVPAWMRNSGKGWVTAEYGMLPRATGERMRREAAAGQAGRPHAGDPAADRPQPARRDRPAGARARCRSPSTATCSRPTAAPAPPPSPAAGSRCTIACAGWRRGRWSACRRCCSDHVAAISCGICEGQPVIDLDYVEDSAAGTDANFVMTGEGGIVEVQGTAEGVPFSRGGVPGAAGARQEGHPAPGRPAADGGGLRGSRHASSQPSSNRRSTSTISRRRKPSTATCSASTPIASVDGPPCLLPLRRRRAAAVQPRRHRSAAAARCAAAGAAAWRARPRASVLCRRRRGDRRLAKPRSRRKASPSRPISTGRTAAARSISATRPAIRSNSPSRGSGGCR